MIPTPVEYHALLRRDLCAFTERCFYELNPTTTFLPNWHIEVAASALGQCMRGEITRLIINQPPRSLKSHLASISFVAFVLGHDPSAKIICTSYGQDLSSKLAMDCRTILNSSWYQAVFPQTRLSSEALQELVTTRQGFRLSTSVGGVLTGRGADYIIIDDPLKPDEALSDAHRKAVNGWFDGTLYTRLNDKRKGRIILVMQRLHEDDLVGHVLQAEPWEVIRFPAIAEEPATYTIPSPYGMRRFTRRMGEALHPEREPLEVLNKIREAQGEYNFAGQYQQSPSPSGGGLVKQEWFKTYTEAELPSEFEMVLQSWDTANKPSQFNDYSVCTTWGVENKHLYLIHVHRKHLAYPELKRAVREQAELFDPQTILIEDRASGTQLIQELVREGMHTIQSYKPTMDKTMRMHSVTSTIENGFVHLPEEAVWLGEYLHELSCFPNGKYDDQADSTSQALDWFKSLNEKDHCLFDYLREEAAKLQQVEQARTLPPSRPCPRCNQTMSQVIPGGLRCAHCGEQWSSPRPPIWTPTRKNLLDRRRNGIFNNV